MDEWLYPIALVDDIILIWNKINRGSSNIRENVRSSEAMHVVS